MVSPWCVFSIGRPGNQAELLKSCHSRTWDNGHTEIKEITFKHTKKLYYYYCCDWTPTEHWTGSLERWWVLHPWRYFKLGPQQYAQVHPALSKGYRNGQYPESPPTLAVLWFCEEIWFVLAAIHFRIASVCSFFLQSYTAGQVVVTSFLPILSPFSFQRISKENPNQPLKSWPYSVSLKKDTFQLQFQIHTQFTHSASSVIKQDWEKMLSSLAAQRTTLIQLRILFGWK